MSSMIIGVNEYNEIKQINSITDVNLKQIEIDAGKVFGNWSDDRILCHRYREFEGGFEVSPYVQPNKIEEFERTVLNLQAQVIELEFEKIGGTTV